ncbi:FtsB family cell division protein [Ferruginibacter sp. SUN106]|uniref:FtsB family cell division protein n=1 Tax=Ferruginibacter sp. SUN106 TaxID=2978348 RepID=UPI003D35B959
MKLLSHIPSWLKNKYLIAGTAFLVWIFFFDPKDIPSTINRIETYSKLQKNEQHMTKLIVETSKDRNLLKTNSQTIEKYARENYMMKKDNEDLFIITTPSESK